MIDLFGENVLSMRIAKMLMANVRYSQERNRNHKRRVKVIDIDEETLMRVYERQNGKCYWSGLPLDENLNLVKHHPFAISVERVDNDGDYTEDNIVLVRRMFNLGRMAFPPDGYRKCITHLIEELRNG